MAQLIPNIDTIWKRVIWVFLPRKPTPTRELGGRKFRSWQYGEKQIITAAENRTAIPCVLQPAAYFRYRQSVHSCGTCLYSPYIIQGHKAKFHLTPVITSGINDRRQSASPSRTFLLSLPLSRLKKIRNKTHVKTLMLILCTKVERSDYFHERASRSSHRDVTAVLVKDVFD